MCTFMKSCLTRTTVASLTSHSKPKGKDCLQWLCRELQVMRQLSGELNSQDRDKIFHGLQQFKNCFWLFCFWPSCLLILPWAAAPVQDAAGSTTLTSSCKQAKSHRDIPFTSRSEKPWQKGKANIWRLKSFHLPFCKLVLSSIAFISTEVQLQSAILKAAEVTSISDLLIHPLQHITTHPGT